MGQGLHTKILGIAMRELGVHRDSVRVMKTQTDKVPNTSATAASAGADLNGAAVKDALDQLTARLRPVAAALLSAASSQSVPPDEVRFEGGSVHARGASVPFSQLCERAYLTQVQLSAAGFYRTPEIHYDRTKGRGKPFHYFAYGVCAAEVELDVRTGMKRVLRVDVVHDVGDSLNPIVDRGQVEGGLVQGIGWLTGEELQWNKEGRVLTHSASTYQIPSMADAPAQFHVELWDDVVGDDAARQERVVHGSKAVGEPPLMLAIAVREALRDAIRATGVPGPIGLPSPLTHETLFTLLAKGGAARL
jgi:xanthine dehydrogenase molybdopterin-binding subunit B